MSLLANMCCSRLCLQMREQGCLCLVSALERILHARNHSSDKATACMCPFLQSAALRVNWTSQGRRGLQALHICAAHLQSCLQARDLFAFAVCGRNGRSCFLARLLRGGLRSCSLLLCLLHPLEHVITLLHPGLQCCGCERCSRRRPTGEHTELGMHGSESIDTLCLQRQCTDLQAVHTLHGSWLAVE